MECLITPASRGYDSLVTAGCADELPGQTLMMNPVSQSMTIRLVIMRARG